MSVLGNGAVDNVSSENSADDLPALGPELEDLLTPQADDHLCRLPSQPARYVRDALEHDKVPALPEGVCGKVFRANSKPINLDRKMPWQPSGPSNSALYKAHVAHAAEYETRLEQYRIEKTADDMVRKLRKGVRESCPLRQTWIRQMPKANLDRLMACRGLNRGDVRLEDIFDEPDAPIGIFDQNEVDHCFERERKVVVKDLRAGGMSENEIEETMVECTGMSSTELEEKGNSARQALVTAGKMSPGRRAGQAPASRPQRRRRTPYSRS